MTRSGRGGDFFLKRKRPVIVIAAGITMLTALLAGGGWESDLRVLRDQVRAGPASGEILIVEMDGRSDAAIGRWPWPRRYHAALIDRLIAADARSIAFDVDFSSLSTPAEDDRLAKSIARAAGKIVLPTFRQEAGSGRRETVEAVPIPLFREGAFIAGVNVRPDADGRVRELPLGVVTAGSVRPALAAMVAERAAASDATVAVDYAIRPASIPRLSYIDIVEGKVPAARLRGKRVIVGATAIQMGDRYAVPGHGVIPGVVILALAAETLLRGVPGDWGALPALFLAMLAIAALAWGSSARRIWFFGAVGMAVLALPLALEQWAHATLDVVPALAALVGAGGVAGGLRLIRLMRSRSLVDDETGLPNRLSLERTAATRGEVFVALALVEDFAATAATLGPARSAELVRRAAERMALASRGEAIHRVEEGALAWIIDPNDDEEVGDRFDALAALMRAPIEVAGRPVDVPMSFGVASGAGAEARQLVAHAAVAAARAHKAGQRWAVFIEDDEDEANWRLSLLGELDAALENGHLWVAHQAKLDLATDRIVGSEALVRWQHPVRGAIPPDLFIPMVEAHGRIGELTLHVLEQALADAARWQAAGSPMAVAVNVSVTLLGQSDLVPMIEAALEKSGIAPSMLTLEVTESAAMTGSDEAIAALERLRDLGIRLSVDDYGTGQSTLTYLKRLPACELKIDKSFIQTIADNRNDAVLVRSTIDLAHELGLKVVGEGIEDQECLSALAQMGCDTGQGYFIGRPMDAESFFVHAKRWNEGERRRAA